MLESEFAVPSGFHANAGVGLFRNLVSTATTSALGLMEPELTMLVKVAVCVTDLSFVAGFAITHTATGGRRRIGSSGGGGQDRGPDATGRRTAKMAGGREVVWRGTGERGPGVGTSVRARARS